MQYRQLGRTGISISAIGFGCGGVGGLFVRGAFEEQCAAAAKALEEGINYFDTAANYGNGLSEQHLGRVLQELHASPLVGTKIRIDAQELQDIRTVVRAKLTAGLERLGRDHVDVCTLHTRVGGAPNALRADDVVGPLAEAMSDLVDAGLTRAIGFSGLGDTDAIVQVATSGRFDTVQCYYNVLNQSAAIPGSPDAIAQDFDGLLDIASRAGLGVVGIRVLAGGALSGNSQRSPNSGEPGSAMAQGEEYEADLRRAEALEARLGDFGSGSLPELAIRFALSEQRISTVMIGFSDAVQVGEALRYESLGSLTPDAMEKLRTPRRSDG